MKVRLLTEEQKNDLIGKLVQTDWYFFPVRDINGNWVISEQEAMSCTYPELYWVRVLPEIDWTSHYIPITGTTTS